MTTRQSYELIYDIETIRHLATIERKYYSLIRHTIIEQLSHEPNLETLNRKPLERPSVLGLAWELRFGPGNRFRVFYRNDAEARVVRILVIGVKIGNRLFIGGEEFDL